MEVTDLGVWPGIADRVALVTGASRGIGQAIAQALAVQGAKVVGTATTDEGAARISGWISEDSADGFGTRLDVTDQVSVDECIGRVSDELGAPTILVNNAGITADNLLMRMQPTEWEQVLATNLSSVYRVSKAVLRGMMKARHGRIINISSVVGLSGNPGQTNYSAAKAGMIGFTKSLAREVASRAITVNAIAPGFVETDMTRALEPDQVEALKAMIPSRRLGEVADIAAAAVYLASDAAAYVTGETLNVNGGMHMS